MPSDFANPVFANIIAAGLPLKQWPDGLDATLLVIFLLLGFGLPLLAYVLMFLDFRRYLRSLRRTLVSVARAVPRTPFWAYRERPPCLDALDLQLPCSEADVLAAYRDRVKLLHPDRGGNLREFLRLQQHFEQAMLLARGKEPVPQATFR